jgi:hypothetical protein
MPPGPLRHIPRVIWFSAPIRVAHGTAQRHLESSGPMIDDRPALQRRQDEGLRRSLGAGRIL